MGEINAWWVVIGIFATIICNSFGFGWVLRGWRRDREEIAKDAAEAVALARAIRDVDLLSMRQAHSELLTVVSVQGERISELALDVDSLDKLIRVDLKNVVEGAIKRASEAASNAAWRRRKRT